jgi:hypothetical protein
VRIIPVPGYTATIVKSDMEIGLVLKNYYSSSGNFHSENVTAFNRKGTGCPVSGCNRCEVSDCFYAEFIHSYWGCPGGD